MGSLWFGSALESEPVRAARSKSRPQGDTWRAFLRKNTSAMLLTALVSQSAMLPFVVAAALGLVAHAVTAAPMFVFVMAVSACAQGRTRCAINAAATE